MEFVQVFEVVKLIRSGENLQRVRLVLAYGSVNVQHCCMYYNPINEWGQSIIIPLLLNNLTTIIGQRPHKEDNISCESFTQEKLLFFSDRKSQN